MPFLRKRWPWLLVILFPLLPLWRAIFLGEAIGPFDQIRQMAPWNGPAPDRPFDVLQADAVLQFYPWRDMVFEAWGNMQLPLWNPYQLAGTPLLANSQSAGFYPPHILMGVLHVPTHWAITLLAWFHLALAGLGVMTLARRLGATPEGGAIGGVLFSGSAFMLAWTALPSVISTVAWIPWVLYGVYGLFEDVRRTTYDVRHAEDSDSPASKLPTPQHPTPDTFPNTSTLQHFKTFSGLAFSTGMMLLAGHLQFAFYGLLAAVLILLFLFAFALFDKSSRQISSDRSDRSDSSDSSDSSPQSTISKIPLSAAREMKSGHKPQSTPFRSLLLGVFALAVGGGLAAPQLLPVLEYSKFSHRRNLPSEEGYKAYVAGAIAPFELVGLIYPTAVGLPFEFAPDAKPLSQYWPALVKQGANFAEGAIGIGPLALFGLLMFPWRRTPKRLWVPIATLGVLAFMMALGTVVNKPFYFLIPGWSSTGSPGRIGVLFVMAASVLAGVAVSIAKQDLDSFQKRFFGAVLGVIGGGIFTFACLCLVALKLRPRFEGMEQSVLTGLVLPDGLFFMFLILPPALLLPAARRKPLRALNQWAPAFPPLMFLMFSLLSIFSFWPFVLSAGQPISNSLKSQNGNVSSRSAFINNHWELVVAAPATMPPNTASHLRIHDLAGYDSLLHKDTHLFLGYVNGQDPAPPANGNMQFVKPTADPQKLLEAGVTDVYSRAPVFAQYVPETMENGLLHYRLAPQARATLYKPGKTQPFIPIKIQDGFDRQFIDVTGPGTLVVKDRLMPGWKATVGGAEVPWSKHPAAMWTDPDGRDVQMWRAVEIPEGRFNVDFVYDPPGLKTGLIIFVPCLLLTIGAWAVGKKRRTINDKR